MTDKIIIPSPDTVASKTELPGLVKRPDKRTLQTRRYIFEKQFKYLGLGAVLVACLFLVFLLSTIVGQAIPAFTHYYANIPMDFSGNVDPEKPQKGDYNAVYKKGVAELFPFLSGRKEKRAARSLISKDAGIELREEVLEKPSMIKQVKTAWLPMDDFADLYLKGLVAKGEDYSMDSEFSIMMNGKSITITDMQKNAFDSVLKKIKDNLSVQIDAIEKQLFQRENQLLRQSGTETNEKTIDQDTILRLKKNIAVLLEKSGQLKIRQSDMEFEETLDESTPTVLAAIQGGLVRIKTLGRNTISGTVIVPLSSDDQIAKDYLRIRYIPSPENARKISDVQVALIEDLKTRGLVRKQLNSIFFTHGASREAEQAGIWGAIVGSFLTMLVTLVLAFPLGVATAIYLEEFAPKNWLSHIIEVNINNLAAVPSIIFGLLGLAVFLNWFGMPRSSALVGGLVLALMTLPTIIIASRAALKAVPPSIKEAALGVGASRVQAVFHHVLPLAMPGMLTGTIIGMAQALGETAPLLMIGMVAFIVDNPASFVDPATVLPVQIYMWADFPEPGFQQKTAAAILILLGFLVITNAVAVLLRKKLERRW